MSPVRSDGAMRCASAALVSPIRGRSSKTPTAPRVSPSSRTSPRVGCIWAAASCSSVVLPAPFGPRITHRWSASTFQSTPRSRWFCPRTTSTPVIPTTAPGAAVLPPATPPMLDTPPSNQPDYGVSRTHAAWRRHDPLVTDRTAGVVLPGSPTPLGAHWDGTGTNFALWSAGAQAVDLCLFDPDGTEHRHRLEETTHQVWHGRVNGTGPGQRYGYRVHGTYDPQSGLRHNPAKLLLDPYTRAVDGDLSLHPALFGYAGEAVDSTTRDDQDSAPYVPRGVVVHDPFPWDGDRPLRHSWSDTVIYEVHVKGATAKIGRAHV